MTDYKVNEATVARKAELVDVYSQKLKDAASIVVVDSRGLTVGEDTELRKQLRDSGVELKVVKNSIMRRAAEQAGIDGMDDYFVGPSAIAFSNEDAVAPAKILNDFAKTAKNLAIKAGIIEGKVSTSEEITALASLPSREGLLSMLLSVLQAPVRNVAYAVKAVADDRTEKEGAPVVEEAPTEEAKSEEPVAEAPAEETKVEEPVAEEATETPAEETPAEEEKAEEAE